MKTVLMAFVVLFSGQAMAGYTKNGEAAVQFIENFLKGLSINGSAQVAVIGAQRVLIGTVKGSGRACSLTIKLESLENFEKLIFSLNPDGQQNSLDIYYENYKHMIREGKDLVEKEFKHLTDDSIASISDQQLAFLSLFDGGEVVEMRKDADGLIYEASYLNSKMPRVTCEF